MPKCPMSRALRQSRGPGAMLLPVYSQFLPPCLVVLVSSFSLWALLSPVSGLPSYLPWASEGPSLLCPHRGAWRGSLGTELVPGQTRSPHVSPYPPLAI